LFKILSNTTKISLSSIRNQARNINHELTNTTPGSSIGQDHRSTSTAKSQIDKPPKHFDSQIFSQKLFENRKLLGRTAVKTPAGHNEKYSQSTSPTQHFKMSALIRLLGATYKSQLLVPVLFVFEAPAMIGMWQENSKQ
jgi:hypothetical protein